MKDSRDTLILQVEPRSKTDSLSVIRRNNRIPANVFGLGKKSESISIHRKEFNQLIKNAGENSVIFISGVAKKNIPVLISELTKHPLEQFIQHVSLRRVDLKQKIEQDVPIEVVGEFTLPGATYLLVKDSITISALPEDFSESFVVDVSQFKTVDDTITVADLDIDATKATVVLHEDEKASEVQVVVVQEIKEESADDSIDNEEVANKASQESPEKPDESAEVF